VFFNNGDPLADHATRRRPRYAGPTSTARIEVPIEMRRDFLE
jgi:hypothetical protein